MNTFVQKLKKVNNIEELDALISGNLFDYDQCRYFNTSLSLVGLEYVRNLYFLNRTIHDCTISLTYDSTMIIKELLRDYNSEHKMVLAKDISDGYNSKGYPKGELLMYEGQYFRKCCNEIADQMIDSKIVEDNIMAKKENYKAATDYDLTKLFGSDELVTKLQAVFSEWCEDTNYTGTLARVYDLNIDDIPKKEQLATKPSITSVWDSTILMFFHKSKIKNYYIYSLTDNKSREILANDFPELYCSLLEYGGLDRLPFSDNY